MTAVSGPLGLRAAHSEPEGVTSTDLGATARADQVRIGASGSGRVVAAGGWPVAAAIGTAVVSTTLRVSLDIEATLQIR